MELELESLLDKLKDYYLDKCSKNTAYHHVYIMKNIKTGKKKIVDITLYDLDEVIIKKNTTKHKYIVKITDDPTYIEIAKYSKYQRKYIPIVEDAYLYNNYFRKIDEDKHDANVYIENYRSTLNNIYNKYKKSETDHDYFNLFEKVIQDKNYIYNEKSEIDDWLKIIKDNNKKLSLCHNYFENQGKLYHLLILPDISRGFFDNTIDIPIDPYTSIFEMQSTNDGRNQMNKIFTKAHTLNTEDTKINDLETIYRFVNREYLLQHNKGIQIKYSLFILGVNKQDDIISLRDIKTDHNELLCHIYRLSVFFMYKLYGFTSNHLNILTRNPTDAYGILYFKISNYTPYNHFIYREGVYEKDHDLFAIIENNKINNYYAKKVFEYQIEYYQYKEKYEKKLNQYIQDPKRNINYVNMLINAVKQFTKIPLDTTLVNCYKKEYKLCDKTILNNEKIRNEYVEGMKNPFDRLRKDNYLLKKEKEKEKEKERKKKTLKHNEIPKNMEVVRFLDDSYKNYSIITKDKDKYKLFNLSPKFHCDNYIDLLSQIYLKKIVSNNNFTVYMGYINENSIYSNVYKINECTFPDLKCIYPNKTDITGLFNGFPRTKIIYSEKITKQIGYHFDYVTKNKITTSYVSTVPPFLQLIYLGLNENMLKNTAYVFNNGKFIICPDPKWIEKLSDEQLKDIIQTYKKEKNIEPLPQIHYTAWYNPYTDNIFSLWDDALIINNKKTINPITLKKIMDNISNTDIEYNIYRNIHKAFNEGWFNGSKNIVDQIHKYYEKESNLESIFRKEKDPYFLNLADPKILSLDKWTENINLFMKNNELIKDKRLISYIHKGNDPLTMILHIHLVFESLKYDTNIDIGAYEQRFTSENTNDVLYNLELKPDYYNKGNHVLLSKVTYSTFYVNITDHIDPILFNYPLYPTFNLKIVKLNNKNIIYPNNNCLNNKLGFGYDDFTDFNKEKYITYVLETHENIDNIKPFTFEDWILNRKIRDIYKEISVLLKHFTQIENFSNYVSKLWDQDISIREFYQNVISEYSRINDVFL